MTNSARHFKRLVRALLENVGFEFDRATEGSRADEGFDLAGRFGSERWAVEAKYYRTDRPQIALLEAAALQLLATLKTAEASRAMLVASCYLGAELAATLTERYGVFFVGREDIYVWASRRPDLTEEFSVLFERSPIVSEGPEEPKHAALARSLQEAPQPLQRDVPDTQGTSFCDELLSLKKGKKTAQQYEDLGLRILKYLFALHLDGWHKQKATEDGLNRYDVVCRIKPLSDFWQFVVHQLGSRYVVFEFKNYSERLKQGEVLTTEKYLFEKGLRRVAIIFSREGASEGALKMTRGAMREAGNLMLIVNDKQVCRMLHMKEQGDDPADFLFELADEFLLTLAR